MTVLHSPALNGAFDRAVPQRVMTLDLARFVIDAALQPIVETMSGEVFAYEALMRGFDKLGFDGPADFLDHMHRSGELLACEKLIQHRAVGHFSGLNAGGSRLLFVNVDGRILGDERLIDNLLENLQAWGISPTNICIELPETHNHATGVAADRLLSRLKREGIRVAIDDFGTGFAELRLLCDRGVDFVKIDRYFVQDSLKNPRKKAMISAIADLAHVLGARVIAEGIETEDEYLVCLDTGCDLIQGYFVAHPSTTPNDILPTYAKISDVRSRLRRTRRRDEFLVRSEMQALPTIQFAGPLAQVFELFAAHPQQNFFPVVDNAGLPLGLIHEREIKHLVYSDFGRDLARNKSLRPDLQRFIRPAPVAEIGASAEHLLELLASSGIGEALVITENLRYAGVLSPTALLKIIAERKIRIAEDRNPLTGMPGNTAIADFVASSISENGTTRLLCYFDFDHFKPFNDAYGFPFGDKAILLFSRLMREHFMDQRHFTAHIGGDDFFAGLVGIPAEEARGLISALLSHFARDMAELYTPEDRLAGYIQGNDRSGNPTRFPLIRCSCAVLELAPNYLSTDSDVVSRMLGKMKGKAKKSPDGLAWHALASGGQVPTLSWVDPVSGS